MKKLNLVFYSVIVTMIFFTVSCKDGGNSNQVNSNSSNDIVGKWEIVKAEGDMADLNKGQIYEFSDDGTANISGITNYDYKIIGDTLIMDYEGQGEIVLKWIIELNGDNMTLDNASDAHQTFWFERK